MLQVGVFMAISKNPHKCISSKFQISRILEQNQCLWFQKTHHLFFVKPLRHHVAIQCLRAIAEHEQLPLEDLVSLEALDEAKDFQVFF